VAVSDAKPLKLTEPWFDETERKAVEKVLASGQLIQAGRVHEFEQLLALETGAEHAVTVSSGTAALHLAMLAFDIGPGDAVAVPDFTFVATANAVAVTGATPVFVDVSPDTYNMDAVFLQRTAERMDRRRRQGGSALRMVMPVHQFGLPAEMGEIAEVAQALLHGGYLAQLRWLGGWFRYTTSSGVERFPSLLLDSEGVLICGLTTLGWVFSLHAALRDGRKGVLILLPAAHLISGILAGLSLSPVFPRMTVIMLPFIALWAGVGATRIAEIVSDRLAGHRTAFGSASGRPSFGGNSNL